MYYLGIFLCSFLISLLLIPSIIHIARTRNLYDEPNHFRKTHPKGISSLGGVAIFVSFVITLLLSNNTMASLSINALLIACILIFITGLKDDLTGVSARSKLIVQLVAAMALVFSGNAQPQPLDHLLLSILFIIFITNAFNFIDGTDGLAAIIGVLVNFTFFISFFLIGHYKSATLSLAIVGAISGFIRFNFPPARIFMGDTGSLLIGLISAVMAIEFVKNFNSQPCIASAKHAAIAIVIAILIVPISDTIRACTIRIYKGKSPFEADRIHIHHWLLNKGFTHLHITVILASINIIVILIALVCFIPDKCW